MSVHQLIPEKYIDTFIILVQVLLIRKQIKKIVAYNS